MPAKRILLSSLLVILMLASAEEASACGGFEGIDSRSKASISFRHNATYVKTPEKRGRAIGLWIYADVKKHDVFAIVHSAGPFAHLHTKTIGRKLPVYNVNSAHRMKQLWFEGERLLFEGREIGKVGKDSLTLGTTVYDFEFAKKGSRKIHLYDGAWSILVKSAGKTVFSSERAGDICVTDEWKRPEESSQREVMLKRIALYLAAEHLASRGQAPKTTTPAKLGA